MKLESKNEFLSKNDKKEFALTITVIRLQESALRRQITQIGGLNWKSFSEILKAGKLTGESKKLIESAKDSPYNIGAKDGS